MPSVARSRLRGRATSFRGVAGTLGGVSLDRSMIADVRSLSDPELRRLVILAQDLLERRGAGRVPDGAKITYRREEVRCGKANCTRCPHGPYWYAYWREDGRLRSRYLGSAKAGRSPGDEPSQAETSAEC